MIFRALLMATCLTASTAWACPTPEHQIKAVIGQQYDQAELKVDTWPVVVAGKHAIAGWTQGERGGRALLQKQGEQWQVMLCGGAGLRQRAGLLDAGVGRATADKLLARLAKAEQAIPAERRQRFDSFDAMAGQPHAARHGQAAH